MFAGRFSSHIGLLGIDIGSRSIKLLQLQHLAGKKPPAPTSPSEPHNTPFDTLEVIGAGEVDQNHSEQQSTADHATDPSHDRSDQVSHAGDAHQPEPEARDSDLETRHASVDTAPTPGVSALTARLRATFASGRFTGRRCVVSLPREDVRVQSVRLPKMPDAELRQAVQWEAAQRFGMSHDAMQVDFIRTGATLQSGESREEVIILAASHETIERRLTPIIEAGFRPTAIDTDFAALGRVFSRHFRRESDRQTVRAIVELGTTGSTVLIMRGDQICFCKPLEVSGRDLNHAVAEHLDIDLQSASELRLARMIRAGDTCQVSGAPSQTACKAEVSSPDTHHLTPATCHDPSTERAIYEAVRPVINELVREVNMCLRYFGVTFRGKPPSQIILTGGDGLEPHLAEHIERGCKIAVAHDDQHGTLCSLASSIQRICHGCLSGPAHFRHSSSPGCWAVAAGLSLRGIAVGEESLLGRVWRAAGLSGQSAIAPAMKGAA